MTVKEFCKKTGWPLEEFRALRVTEVAELLSLYGLKMVVKNTKVFEKLQAKLNVKQINELNQYYAGYHDDTDDED